MAGLAERFAGDEVARFTLMRNGAYPGYPEKVKLSAARRVLEGGESCLAVARSIGVTDTSVRRWVYGENRTGRHSRHVETHGGRSPFCPCGARLRHGTDAGRLVDYCLACRRPPELVRAARAVPIDIDHRRRVLLEELEEGLARDGVKSTNRLLLDGG